MITLKDLAAEIGTSKQAVYKRIKGSLADSMRDHMHIQDTVMYIDDEGIVIVKNAFKSNTPGADTEANTETHTVYMDYINTLKKELSMKDEVIRNLEELLSNQQKLTLLAAPVKAGFFDRFKKKKAEA